MSNASEPATDHRTGAKLREIALRYAVVLALMAKDLELAFGPAGEAIVLSPGHAATALKALRGAIDALGVPPDGPQFPAGVRVVQEETWRQWFYDATEEAVTADTKKKRFRRAMEALASANTTGRCGIWVWIQP
jgi:hypothetical protein